MKLYLETTMFNYYFDTERDGHADTVRVNNDKGYGTVLVCTAKEVLADEADEE